MRIINQRDPVSPGVTEVIEQVGPEKLSRSFVDYVTVGTGHWLGLLPLGRRVDCESRGGFSRCSLAHLWVSRLVPKPGISETASSQ
jgi:hypothetical protein